MISHSSKEPSNDFELEPGDLVLRRSGRFGNPKYLYAYSRIPINRDGLGIEREGLMSRIQALAVMREAQSRQNDFEETMTVVDATNNCVIMGRPDGMDKGKLDEPYYDEDDGEEIEDPEMIAEMGSSSWSIQNGDGMSFILRDMGYSIAHRQLDSEAIERNRKRLKNNIASTARYFDGSSFRPSSGIGRRVPAPRYEISWAQVDEDRAAQGTSSYDRWATSPAEPTLSETEVTSATIEAEQALIDQIISSSNQTMAADTVFEVQTDDPFDG